MTQFSVPFGPDARQPGGAGADTGWMSYRSLHSFAESPRDRNLLWVGTNDSYSWITTDGGRNWRNATNAIPDAQAQRCVSPRSRHRSTTRGQPISRSTYTVSLKAGRRPRRCTFEVKRDLGEESPGRVR